MTVITNLLEIKTTKSDEMLEDFDPIEALKSIPWWIWLIAVILIILGIIISPIFFAILLIGPLEEIIIIILVVIFVKIIYDKVIKGGK